MKCQSVQAIKCQGDLKEQLVQDMNAKIIGNTSSQVDV